MRRFLPWAMIFIMSFPLFFSPFPLVSANSVSAPLAPHEVKVLVVSPANVYWSGGYYLISDLARYGFDATEQTSDDALSVDYRFDSKTSDLSQYQVVILHGGYFGPPPTLVSVEEVSHFMNYNGVLIVVGNALFGNETSRTYWGNTFDSEPIRELEQRLGVDFTGFFGQDIILHNSGTFTLVDNSIEGLPSHLTYISGHPTGIISQIALQPAGARTVYDFNTTSPVSGKVTSGVTYYKNPTTGAVGIYIQGSCIYATESPGPKISYFGLTNSEERSKLLASLIAYALGSDISTVIKPQPLATIRLDEVGSPAYDADYLSSSLGYFNSAVDAYGVLPSIAFTDYYDVLAHSYWETDAPSVLEQLKTLYRDWEYSSFLQRKDPGSMSQSQIESLIESSRDNYTALGMDLFSTIVAPLGSWSQSLLEAMITKKLYLLELSPGPYAPTDWWNTQVNSSILIHTGAQMAGTGSDENFTQISKDTLHYEYFANRDKLSLAVINGFPGFFYSVPNFRRNEVGTYSLQTIYLNLTSEIPDIRFVPLLEAGLNFGNKWVHINKTTRSNSTVEFDLDCSAIPEVAAIGKGMIWLRIDANETISEVLIDGKPWYYFDDNSVRMPTHNAHVKVTLGARNTPTVDSSVYKVIGTEWTIKSFDVIVAATEGFNITLRLLIPEIGAFVGDRWNVFCSAQSHKWGYRFDSSSRILFFWAISDGLITFQAGPDVVPPVFWEIRNSPTWYNSSVLISANVTDLQTAVANVTLSYARARERASIDWTNVTMILEKGWYVAAIPPFPFGTEVQYRLCAFDDIGNLNITEILSYNVADDIPPEMGNIEWGPESPSSEDVVYVRVNVTEPEFASGVHYVVLFYWVNRELGTVKLINMTRKGDIWSAVIPPQSGGATVSFFVYAYDNANNRIESNDENYKVTGSGMPFWIFFLIGVAVFAGAGATAIVYFKKIRRGKTTTTEPKRALGKPRHLRTR